jgi:hypothetical protein
VTRCYVYGQGNAAIFALLKDPAFMRLLAGLFAAGAARPASGAEEETAVRAAEAGLLSASGADYGAGPRLVPIPRHALRDASARMAPALDRYAAIAGEAAAGLREAYGRTGAAATLPWRQVEHTVVAGMLLDLSVGSRLWLDGHVERGCNDTLVWAFEDAPGVNAFGVQWSAAEGECAGLAQLWHGAVPRAELRVPGSAVASLARLALGDGHPLPPSERLLLRYLGLVEAGPDGGDRCTVATFGAHDMEEHLLPVLWSAAERLVAEGVLPALEAGLRAEWWSPRAGEDAVHHALVRMVLERGTDRVVDTGVVAPFAAGDAGAAWGRWLWAEHPGHPTLVAGGFEAATPAGQAA